MFSGRDCEGFFMRSAYKRYFITAALIWAACFIGFIFVYLLVLAPQEEAKKKVEEQLIEKTRIYNFALRASQEETRKRINEQMENLRGKLKDFVIDFEESAHLAFDISQIAKEQKITPSNIDMGKELRGPSLIADCDYISESRIEIRFSAASFHQFAAFLNALERYRPVIFVDSFKITRADKKDSGHQANMNLSIFVGKQKKSQEI